ncbi:MAG: Hpt domain-containing protein [Planctomycetaceae bacterium]|nr:Hpt domain-containing protein [Planctomycetaceae bacterium]
MTKPRLDVAVSPEMQIVDVASALDRIGGDAELFQELAAIFIEDSPGLMAALQRSLTEGNLPRAEHYAHGLKGIAANVGGVRVESCARRIEQLLHSGELEPAADDAVTLAAELDRLLTTLAAHTAENAGRKA